MNLGLCPSKLSWGSTIDTVAYVKQIDLMKNVVSVVQRAGSRGQAGELLDQPGVVPQQPPHLVLQHKLENQSLNTRQPADLKGR